MAFDASVIQDISTSVPDIPGSIAKGYQLKDLMNVQQLNSMRLKDEQTNQAEDQKIKDLGRKYDLSTREGQMGFTEAASKVNPQKAMKLTSEMSAIEGGKLENELKRLQVGMAKQEAVVGSLGQISQALDGLKAQGATPAMLDAKAQEYATGAMKQLVQQHPELKETVAQFASQPITYQSVHQAFAQSQKGKAQLEAHFKEAQIKNFGSEAEHRKVEESQGQQKIDIAKKAAEAGRPSLDPDTLDVAATVVMADPARIRDYASGMGKGGQAIRNQINSAVTEKLKASGMTPQDLVQARARSKAELTSIGKMTQQQNAIETFEKLARFNGERVLELLDKVDATGVPMVEGVRRAGAQKLGGVDVAEFKSVLTTFQQEAARILANPNMTGVVTDSLRNEIMAMAPENMSSDQGKRVINRLFSEMDMRKAYITQQIKEASGGLNPGAPAAPKAEDPLGIR